MNMLRVAVTQMLEHAEIDAGWTEALQMALDATQPNIAERMHAVMASVGGIERTNSEGVTYKFRSIEQIAPLVQAALIVHGVIVLPVDVTVLDTVERDRGAGKTPQRVVTLRVAYHLINIDDPADRLEAAMVGESADFGAKTVTQALTFVYKCLWLQALCIGDPLDDADTIVRSDDGEQIRLEWDASEEEIDQVRVAATMLDDEQRAFFAAWWKSARAGSITNRHVNARHVPAALALIQTLLDMSEPTTEDETSEMPAQMQRSEDDGVRS